MRLMRLLRGAVVGLAAATGAGCGADRSGITNPGAPPAPTHVRLQSDAGDRVGQGRSYDYTQSNAVVTVSQVGTRLSFHIQGDQSWYGEFQFPGGTSQIRPGTYTGLQGYDPAKGWLRWFSDLGSSCYTPTGSFTVDSVTYVTDSLAMVDLRFEQRCEGATAALHGSVHWRADDPTRPPGPITPIPAELWQPPAGSAPPSTIYVYLQSDPNDYIGAGRSYTLTPKDAGISVRADGGHLIVTAGGWTGDFQAMSPLSRIEPGYYPGLRRYPFHNPAKGGLDWSGNGNGCNALSGWFAVDRITYVGNGIKTLDLRFEQHCEGAAPALRGVIHWAI